MARTKYIINDMVWDLVTTKGKFHLAKVTLLPITGLLKTAHGEPARAEYILGPNHKWHTATCYLPVDPPTEKALSKALEVYQEHETRVSERMRAEEEERERVRKLNAQRRALQNTKLEIYSRTLDGKKLSRNFQTWDLEGFLSDEGWSISYRDIELLKDITCVGTHQFWVNFEGDPNLGVEIALVIKPDPRDAELRAEEEQKKKKWAEEVKRKREVAAEKRKAAAAKRKATVARKKIEQEQQRQEEEQKKKEKSRKD